MIACLEAFSPSFPFLFYKVHYRQILVDFQDRLMKMPMNFTSSDNFVDSENDENDFYFS